MLKLRSKGKSDPLGSLRFLARVSCGMTVSCHKRVSLYLRQYRNEGKKQAYVFRSLTDGPKSPDDNFSQFPSPFQIWKQPRSALLLSIAACSSYRCRITAAPASRWDFISSARLAPKRRHYRNPLDCVREGTAVAVTHWPRSPTVRERNLREKILARVRPRPHSELRSSWR